MGLFCSCVEIKDPTVIPVNEICFYTSVLVSYGIGIPQVGNVWVQVYQARMHVFCMPRRVFKRLSRGPIDALGLGRKPTECATCQY